MKPINRRSLLKVTGAGIGATAIAGCLGDDEPEDADADSDVDADDDGPEELTDMHVIEPEGAVTIPMYLWGIDEDAWVDNGIDLNLEVAAFGKFTRQLVDDLAPVGGHSIMYGIQFMDEGEAPMTSIGQQLNFYNQIMSKTGSGIDDPIDLENAHLGVPPMSSQTSIVVQSMIKDEYDFDIFEDPEEVTTSPPPALWGLFQDDEIDAVLQFSGFTIAGNADPDVQTVFDPYEFWVDRTGQPPSVADFVVYEDWLEDNASTALNYLNGWWDAEEIFLEDADEAIENYGLLGGIETDEEKEVATEWAQDGVLTPLERGYSQELADSTRELMELLAEYGHLDALPDDTDPLFTTTEELEEMAE